METVNDCLEHIKWLIDKGRGSEPAKIYLPRLEAQRRKVNREQHRRVVFVTDPITYGEWHGQKDRWVELCGGNPTIAYPLMLKVLAAVSDEAIRGLAEEGLND